MAEYPQIVDGTGVRWHPVPRTDGTVYRRAHPPPGPAVHYTLTDLTDRCPPIRKVGPPTAATVDRFRTAVRRLIMLRPLRPRLVGTVAAAVHDAAAQAGHVYPLVAPSPRSSHEDAIAVMAAHVGPTVAAEPRRLDPLARDDLAEILLEWVTDPGHYTCPASNLASLLAVPVVISGGWFHVTDQQLRASAPARLLRWYVSSGIEKACTGSS